MLASDHTDSTHRVDYSNPSDIVELVVFTTDEAFMQTLRDAVGTTRRLWHVPSADKVSDLLVAGQVGILVLDVQALAADPGVFVTQLKRQFPDLVLLAAGNREVENSLANLISTGVIHRFIHKPVSPGRAKLFADAAVKKFSEQRRRMPAAPPRAAKPPGQGHALLMWGGALAVAVVIVATALWSRQRKSPSLPAIVAQHAPAESAPGAAPVAPGSDAALESDQQALARNPDDAGARTGMTEVQERQLARAESALLEERLDEAAAAIDAARKAGVDAGRLALLSTQLGKARQRQKTGVARTKDDAGAANPQQSDARVTQALRLAEERVKQGRLVDPVGDSARAYVQEALSMDPRGNAVQAAKQTLAIALLSEARSAIDRRDFAHAALLIDDAEGIAAPANLDNARQLLAASRKQAVIDDRERLLKTGEERLRQDRLIEPAMDSARYYLSTLRSEDPGYPGLAAALQELGGREVAAAHRAFEAKQYDAARNWLSEAAAAGYASADANTLTHDIESAATQQRVATTSVPDLVPANELTLIKSVKPAYPLTAEKAKTEGWVELDFTVTDRGTVRDVAVHAANPPGTFNAAAIGALSQWRYQPPQKDGKPAAARSRIRIRFSLGS